MAHSEPVRRQKVVQMTIQVAVCPARGCWREFKPSRTDQVYCSGACRRRANRDRDRETCHEERHGYMVEP